MEEKKVVSIEDRIPKLKEARKKKANTRLLFYLSIFFLLISIIIYLQSPLSNIKEIEVTGNKILSDDQIIELSGLAPNKNIWVINPNSVKQSIENHTLIDDIEVERKLPQSVHIDVTEHKIVGYIKEEGQYSPVLHSGIIVTNLNIQNKGDGPLLHHFDDEEYLKRMAKELTEIPTNIFNLISEVTWEPTEKNKYKIVLYMNDGFIVHATIRNFASKMKSYPSIIAQLNPDEKGIVHMGVGTYFEKLKNE